MFEERRLTKIIASDSIQMVQFRFRPEGAYRVPGKAWGVSTVDLSFAVHNRRIEAGRALDVTSESKDPDGTLKRTTETLIYVKQDERLAAKGEWGPHYFVKLGSIGEENLPAVVTKGTEIVGWKESHMQPSPEDKERALAKAEIFFGQQLPGRQLG